MGRIVVVTLSVACILGAATPGQGAEPDWRMVYTRSHRATFEQQWKYTFPKHKSRQWFIALEFDGAGFRDGIWLAGTGGLARNPNQQSG